MVKLTVWNDTGKPHKGRIDHWTHLKDEQVSCVCGLYLDHPQFKNEWGHTSHIENISEPNRFGYKELETQNSRYTLVGKELTWEEYVQKRQAVESEHHAQAYRLLSNGPKPVHVQGNNNKERDKKRNGKPTYYTRATQTRAAPRNNSK